jgi:hypothetical protein
MRFTRYFLNEIVAAFKCLLPTRLLKRVGASLPPSPQHLWQGKDYILYHRIMTAALQYLTWSISLSLEPYPLTTAAPPTLSLESMSIP